MINLAAFVNRKVLQVECGLSTLFQIVFSRQSGHVFNVRLKGMAAGIAIFIPSCLH